MKKPLITSIALGLTVFAVYSQQAIVTSGNYNKNETQSLSWSLGETVIETFILEDIILTQGFQQSNITIVGIDELPELGFQIKAFPNPTRDLITLEVDEVGIENLTFRVYDINGQFLISQKFTGLSNKINLEYYPSGVYFLRVLKGVELIKTFKIIKK